MGFEDDIDNIFDKVFGLFGVGLSVSIVMSVITFLLSFGIITAVIVMLIKSWKKNNNSPRLSVAATIVSKRERISHSHHHRHNYANAGNMNDVNSYNNSYYHSCDTGTSTFYYVTFQLESGDRVELCVPVYEFGLLIEGDRGKLTFQGTRYLSFERD